MDNSTNRRLLAPFLLLAALALLALSACGSSPAWQTDPSSLTFTGQVGEGAPPAQTLALKNTGGNSQPFTLSADASWIHATPTSGELEAGETANIQVSVDACTEVGMETTKLNISGAASASVSVTRDCAPASGAMVWVNQFGGEGDDRANKVVVDDAGYAYVLGDSSEKEDGDEEEDEDDIPVEHLFVVKFDPAGDIVWRYQVDSVADQYSFTNLAVAKTGEVYVIGMAEGGFPDGEPTGERGALLLKLSAAGELLWHRQFGSGESEYPHEIALDEANGQLYIVGRTYGDFADPEADYSSSTYFLAAYDTSGGQQWAFSFDRTQRYTGYPHLALDPDGNPVVSGNIYNPTEDTGGLAAWDVFVGKYDASDGSRLHRYDLASDDYDGVDKPFIAANGQIYIAGTTSSTLPGQTSQGGKDAYVLKLDPDLNPIWLNQFGTAGNDGAGFGAVDAEGNVYLFGMTSGAFPGQTLLGDYDPYLAKLDGETGALEWATQFGTSEYEEVKGMKLGASGHLVVFGRTEGSFPGYTVNGRMDPYVAAYDTSGNQLWLTQFSSQDNGETANRDWLNDFALDAAGDIYLLGETNGVYPGETPLGETDAFLIKFQH